MAQLRADLSLNEVHISEKSKDGPDYLKGMTDYWIGKLVINKEHIPTCRKYYSGVRDTEEYDYLNDNYGIGNAIDIQFTPIIKPRIDALVGLFLSESFSYRVDIADDPTLVKEAEARKNYIINDMIHKLSEKNQALKNHMRSKEREGPTMSAPSEVLTKKYAEDLQHYLDTDFTTVYAEAAQHLLQYFEQSNTLDFKRKFAELLYDLLITGEMFWRSHVEEVGKDPIFEVKKPENIFFNKNKSDLYLDTADAVVNREFITRHQALQKYGHLMTSEDIKVISGRWGGAGNNRNVVDPEMLHMLEHDDFDEFSNYRQFTGDPLDVIEIHHVEWLASSRHGKKNGKSGWIEHRYECTRILGSVYVGMGKSKGVVRTQNNPFKASLSYSGLSYNLRQGAPYSMVLSLKDVQDMYDITQFHRNNLVASSGVSGTRVNIAGIPKVLGTDFMGRLMKWIALKKQGIELIDPTEEGAQLFNHYGEFQGGIDGNAINGINAILQTFNEQVVLTTGVTDQMLGQIQEREAVENVKTGIRQVSLITLNIFDLLDGARKRALTGLIDLSKISYTKGKMGAYKVGKRNVAFKLDKDNYSWTDYNIQVSNSSKDTLKLQKLENIVTELIGAGLIKPETAIELTFCNTLFEAREIIYKGMNTDKEREEQMGQMDKQLKEYEEQIKELSGQSAKSQQEKDRFSAEQMKLDRVKLEHEIQYKDRELDIKEAEQQDKSKFQDEQIQAKREVVQLEREQLYIVGGNEQSKEINNSKV